MRLLEHDAELGADIEPARAAVAAEQATVAIFELPRGKWTPREWPEAVRRGVGLLVLDGLLLRRVRVEGRFGAELLAAGDLLRPWQREEAVASASWQMGWRVLEDCQIALLDLDFTRRMAPFPEVIARLSGRALRRSSRLLINGAIVHQPKVEMRLRLLLWYFADRWGVVRKDGVLVPLQLTHSIFGELLAARRPTVSAAVGALERAGTMRRTRAGWLLLGEPPGELMSVLPSASAAATAPSPHA